MATNYIQLCYWKPQLNSIGWNISDDWKFFELFIFNTRLDKAQPNNRMRVRPKTTTTSKNLTSLKGREVLDVAFCRLRCQNIHTHTTEKFISNSLLSCLILKSIILTQWWWCEWTVKRPFVQIFRIHTFCSVLFGMLCLTIKMMFWNLFGRYENKIPYQFWCEKKANTISGM